MPHNTDEHLDADPYQDDPDLLEAERPGWPKVVGILSIIFASLSLFCGVVGTGMAFASEPIMTAFMGAQLGDTPPPPFSPPPDAIFIVSVVISLSLNLLLLIAGIQTIRRRANGRSLHLVYALFGVLATGYSVYAQMHGQVAQQQAMDAWLEQHGETDFGKQIAQQVDQQRASQGVTSLIGIGVGLVIGLAWPLFCLLWFGPMGKQPDALPAPPTDDF